MLKKLATLALSAIMAAALCVPVLAADGDVKSVNIRSSSTQLLIGDTRTLYASVTPSDANDPTLAWSSSDTSIVDVDDNGTVTALDEGRAVITARSSNGKKDTCVITVEDDYKVKTVEMSMPTLTVRMNQTRTLWASITPVIASDKDIFWSSSDTSVAEVDPDGTVTGVGPGTATITAEAAKGRTGTCVVTVPGKVVKGLLEETVNTELPNSGELLTTASVKTVVEQAAKATKQYDTGTALFENKSSISATMIQAAAFTATSNNRTVQLKFTTANDAGKTQGYVILDPSQYKNATQDVKTGVFVTSKKTESVKKLINKYFSNTVAVIDCTNTGSYGSTVQLAAKVDLTGLNKDSLRFYTYNSATNNCDLLDVASYTVDANGYLRFSSATGGTILVADSVLARK